MSYNITRLNEIRHFMFTCENSSYYGETIEQNLLNVRELVDMFIAFLQLFMFHLFIIAT